MKTLKTRMKESLKVRRLSSFYDVYTRATGKPGFGPGAFGIVILGEGKDDIFGHSYPINDQTFPTREYIAARMALELLDGRQDKKITLHLCEPWMVKQLTGENHVSSALDQVAEDFNEVLVPFSNVSFKHVHPSDRWMTEAKRLAIDQMYVSHDICP